MLIGSRAAGDVGRGEQIGNDGKHGRPGGDDARRFGQRDAADGAGRHRQPGMAAGEEVERRAHGSRLGRRRANRAEGDIVGAGHLGGTRPCEVGIAGNAQQHAGGQLAAHDGRVAVVGADMDAIRIHLQRQRHVVIDDEAGAPLPAKIAQGASQPQAARRIGELVAVLQQPRPAGQRRLRHGEQPRLVRLLRRDRIQPRQLAPQRQTRFRH